MALSCCSEEIKPNQDAAHAGCSETRTLCRDTAFAVIKVGQFVASLCLGLSLLPCKPLPRGLKSLCLHRMRVSLGLKPLSMTNKSEEADKARREQAEAKRLAEQKRLEGERLAARVKA